MLNPRIIPVLLLENDRLVKTVKFSNPKYVGDPINTVRIFNEKQVDEIFIFKIDGNKNLNYSLLNKLASECRMPLCYGGGITSIDQVKKLISLGIEKISICSNAIENYFFIKEAIKSVGKQSVVITVDLKIENKIYIVTSDNGKKKHNIKFEDYLDVLQEINVGEILINLIDRDGTMEGYDLNLAEKVSKKLSMPCTFLGGACSLNDISMLFKKCGIVGAAAGSLFVFKGPYNAVLVNYPSPEQKVKIYGHGLSVINSKRDFCV